MESTLPSDICDYQHQITGYGSILPIKSRPDCFGQFLYSPSERCVYKPVQEPPKGQREMDFYLTVFGRGCSPDEEAAPQREQRERLLSSLRCFLSEFHGVHRQPLSGRLYMRLGDLLDGFVRPSIMDLKMGVRRHEPPGPGHLDQDTEETRPDRYAYRQQTGFFITGLRVWRQEAQSYELYSKRYGRDVTPANMSARVVQPLLSGAPPRHRLRLLRLIAGRLERLWQWFESQRLYHFYASSILLGVECCPEALQRQRDPVTVRMVDFTHVIAAEDGAPDRGFMLGLANLILVCRDCERDLLQD